MRWSVLSCLAWYSVVCRSVLWEVISVTRSGAGFVMSGIGILFWLMAVVGAVIRLE